MQSRNEKSRGFSKQSGLHFPLLLCFLWQSLPPHPIITTVFLIILLQSSRLAFSSSSSSNISFFSCYCRCCCFSSLSFPATNLNPSLFFSFMSSSFSLSYVPSHPSPFLLPLCVFPPHFQLLFLTLFPRSHGAHTNINSESQKEKKLQKERRKKNRNEVTRRKQLCTKFRKIRDKSRKGTATGWTRPLTSRM